MKKALLYGLSAVMLLSLTACGTAQANQPDPVQSPEQSGGIEGYITQSQQTGVSGEEADIGVIGDGEATEAQEISATELYKIFEQGYQGGQIYAEFGLSEEELILMEVAEVESILSVRTDIKAPADLESQYRAWRAEAHPATSTQAPQQTEIQLFVECHEEVYALDQVNIRASYSTSSTRLGSLMRGQSITRIGTAIPGTEAEGWSRVQLSDGTIAYMVSSYLSTSKPQQQNQNRTPQPGSTGGGTGTQTPPQGGGTEGIEPFDYESHKINLEDTKKTTDYGYEESDPGDFIYGP